MILQFLSDSKGAGFFFFAREETLLRTLKVYPRVGRMLWG